MYPAVSTGQDISGILAFMTAYLLWITIFLFAMHILVALLVYRDGKGDSSAAMWAVFIAVLPAVFYYFGIIFYVIAVLVVAVMYALARNRLSGFRHCAKYSGGKCVKWQH